MCRLYPFALIQWGLYANFVKPKNEKIRLQTLFFFNEQRTMSIFLKLPPLDIIYDHDPLKRLSKIHFFCCSQTHLKSHKMLKNHMLTRENKLTSLMRINFLLKLNRFPFSDLLIMGKTRIEVGTRWSISREDFDLIFMVLFNNLLGLRHWSRGIGWLKCGCGIFREQRLEKEK